MASLNSPCAACKFLRRKCTQECVFAPYFPPDQPNKFQYVHKIFGASNVAKILNDLPSNQREDAVNSLFYEADARTRDPVYGCVGLISLQQQRLKQLHLDIDIARRELATYIGPQAMLPILQPQQPHFMPQTQQRASSSSSGSVLTQQQNHSLFPTEELYHQQQQMFEAQQFEAVARERHNETFRAFGEGSTSSHHHQNQPQDEILRFNNGFDSVPTGSVTAAGFNQLTSTGTTVTEISHSLALGGNYVDSSHETNDTYHTDQQLHHQQQQHHEAQIFMPTHSSQGQHQHHEAQLFMPTQSSQPLPQETQETHTSSESDEGRSTIGSSR